MLDGKHKSSHIESMRQLPTEKRVMILNLLVEGMSMRAISRTVGVSINTVTKLLVNAGEACAAYHDETVRNVKVSRVECDEIWSFWYAKERNVAKAKAAPKGAGDVWTWTAIDADSKMILAFEIGDRSAETAYDFMLNLQRRIDGRVQLTTDGHSAYLQAVEDVFGGEIDYAMLVKQYGKATGATGHERKYSPAVCTGTKKRKISGDPVKELVSTSYVERQNLSMRMGMRRFTRLTNAFSKKLQNHLHMLSLYFVHYNFVRIHKTLRMTPAMAAGVSDSLHDMEWIVGLVDARAAKPKRPATYKKSISE
jgi:IS1 family transposase